MAVKQLLSKSLPLSSILLPYYGLVDECSDLMQCLSKKSRKLWQCNEEILIRVIKNKRTLRLENYNQNVVERIDVKSLKYYKLEVENMEGFLIAMLNHLMKLKNGTTAVKQFVDPMCNSLNSIPPNKYLVNYSKCKDFMEVNGVNFFLKDHLKLSKYINKLETERLYNEGNIPQQRLLSSETSNINYIPCFTLKDSTELICFYNTQRRIRNFEGSPMMSDYEATVQMKKPFVAKIGKLKVEVHSESFLKHFFRT